MIPGRHPSVDRDGNSFGFDSRLLRNIGSLGTLLTAVCLLQLLNVVALAAFWPFFGAIVALLLGAMYQFVRLVLSTRRIDT
jgi:hypothetical protein